jgi:hypothetical protein
LALEDVVKEKEDSDDTTSDHGDDTVLQFNVETSMA